MVSLTQFIYNLRQMVRNGFPKGLPIDSLEFKYTDYFPHHRVPTPKSINNGFQGWLDVFKNSDRFTEWFYINEQLDIMVGDKPEPDLHVYLRLNYHDQYLLVRQHAKFEKWQYSESEDCMSDDEDEMEIANLVDTYKPSASASIGKNKNQGRKKITGEAGCANISIGKGSKCGRRKRKRSQGPTQPTTTVSDSNPHTDPQPTSFLPQIFIKLEYNEASYAQDIDLVEQKPVLEPVPSTSYASVTNETQNFIAMVDDSHNNQNPREESLEDSGIGVDVDADVDPVEQNAVFSENTTAETTESLAGQYVIVESDEEEEGEIYDDDEDDNSWKTHTQPMDTSSYKTKRTKIRPLASKSRMSDSHSSKTARLKRFSSTPSASSAPTKLSRSRSSPNSLTLAAKSTKMKGYTIPRISQRKPALLPTPPSSELLVYVPAPVRERLGPAAEANQHQLKITPSPNMTVDYEDSVYAELMSMCAPRSCKLCNIKELYTQQTAGKHFNGKRHASEVELFLESKRVKIIKPEDVRYTGYRDVTDDPEPEPEHSFNERIPREIPTPSFVTQKFTQVSDARQVLQSLRAASNMADEAQDESRDLERRTWQEEGLNVWFKAKRLAESPDLVWCQRCNNLYPPGLPKNISDIGDTLQANEFATPAKFVKRMAYVFAFFRNLNLEPSDQGYGSFQQIQQIFQVELPALIKKYKKPKAHSGITYTYV